MRSQKPLVESSSQVPIQFTEPVLWGIFNAIKTVCLHSEHPSPRKFFSRITYGLTRDFLKSTLNEWLPTETVLISQLRPQWDEYIENGQLNELLASLFEHAPREWLKKYETQLKLLFGEETFKRAQVQKLRNNHFQSGS